jgi:hypothetical protein
MLPTPREVEAYARSDGGDALARSAAWTGQSRSSVEPARLGHKHIQHTVAYTELAPDRFKNFWR